MKKLLISILILGMISLMVNAEDLSDYPDFFIDGDELDVLIVVGDKAPASHVLAQTDILLSLAELVRDARGKTRLASEVDNLDQNLISLGNACVNDITSKILGNPKNCKADNTNIEFFDDKYIHIVLNANSEEAVRELASKLIDYRTINLETVVVKDLDDVIGAKEEDNIQEDKENDEKKTIDEKEIEDKPEVLPQVQETIQETVKEKANEDEEPQPNLKKEESLIKNIISWFISLFK